MLFNNFFLYEFVDYSFFIVKELRKEVVILINIEFLIDFSYFYGKNIG